MGACGAALIGAFLSFLLSAMGFRGARLASVGAALALFIYASDRLGEILSELDWIMSSPGVSEAASGALRIIGIGYVSGICYDVCMEMGERSVASAVLTVGRIEILLAISPAITGILDMAVDMF